MPEPDHYHAIIAMPYAKLGIRIDAEYLIGVEFLPMQTKARAPGEALAREACAQLSAYARDARFHFDLPLRLDGTAFQLRVWQALANIPAGETRSYGEIAQQIASAPRAVGRACGDNPIAVVIPCHRVVAKNGRGGFMHQSQGQALAIKDWLLQHEQGTAHS